MISYFKKFWNGETNGLTAAAFIVGASSIASRIVGMLRDRVLAGTFGAGRELDAYYAAFRLPDALYNLVILGALSAGFIPVFVEYLERKNAREAWELAERVLSVVGATMLAIGAALLLLAPFIVPWLTPGFDALSRETTVRLTRIMMLSPFFLGLSAVMGGVLQATRRFFAFALAPILYNLGIMFGALVLSPIFGIDGVAWGVVAGACLHLIAQWSVAGRLGLRRVLAPSFRHEGVRRILKLMLPRSAGLAVTQVNLFIILALASSLESGSVAVFNLANNIQSFPIGIIGVSFAVAAFPALSRGAQDREAYRASLNEAARKIFFLIIPVTALFLLYRAQIVRLVFGSGKFNWNDTIRTANVLGWFSLSLASQALVALFARAFYAIQDTWTPLLIGFVSEATLIILAFTLPDTRLAFGISRLAVAFSAAAFMNAVLLAIFLRRKRGLLGGRQFFLSAGKTIAASAALLVASYPVRQWFGETYPLTTFLRVALQAGFGMMAGAVAFILAASLLKSEELNDFAAAISKRIWKKTRIKEGIDEAAGV